MAITININHYDRDDKFLTQKLNLIMASIKDLNAKVDVLQADLDVEQQKIADAIAALQQTVTDLQALVVDGGSADERQAVSDKLDAVIADLQATPLPDSGEVVTPEA
jgi:hypothetical protein